MARGAKARFSNDSGWAKASGLPKETLSRLKSQPSCDVRTLGALARTAGYTLVAVPASIQGGESGEHVPACLAAIMKIGSWVFAPPETSMQTLGARVDPGSLWEAWRSTSFRAKRRALEPLK